MNRNKKNFMRAEAATNSRYSCEYAVTVTTCRDDSNQITSCSSVGRDAESWETVQTIH